MYFEIFKGTLIRISLLGVTHITSINEDFFTEVEHVQEIKIHESLISKIEPTTLNNMPELVVFSVVSSQVANLPQNLFSSNDKLEAIIVKYSPLLKINKDITELSNLNYVSFSETKLPKQLRRFFTEEDIPKFKELVLKYFPD